MNTELKLILKKIDGLGSTIKELKSDMQELRTEVKSGMQELRTEVKSDMQELRMEVKSDMQELRTEVKSDMQELRTEVKSDIYTSQTVIETKMDHIIIEMRGQFKYTEKKLNEHTKILQMVSNRLNERAPKLN